MLRFLARLLLAVVVLAVGAAAVILVPAHLQVRRVHPALPTPEEIAALRERPEGPTAVGYLTVSSQKRPDGTLGHTVFVAEWPDGRLFLIDLGMDEAGARDFSDLMLKMGATEAATFEGSIADLLGDDIGRVAGVGFTHLHTDHTQGVGAYCAARGAGSRGVRSTWQDTVHNLHTKDGAALVAGSCLERVVVEGEGLLEVPGFPGLGMIPLGGHTPGSTAFVVPVGEKLWVFSGDTTNRKSDLLDNVGKGFLYSYLIVPEDTGRTEQLRRWFAAIDARDDAEVVVSHDFDALQQSELPRWKPR